MISVSKRAQSTACTAMDRKPIAPLMARGFFFCSVTCGVTNGVAPIAQSRGIRAIGLSMERMQREVSARLKSLAETSF